MKIVLDNLFPIFDYLHVLIQIKDHKEYFKSHPISYIIVFKTTWLSAYQQQASWINFNVRLLFGLVWEKNIMIWATMLLMSFKLQISLHYIQYMNALWCVCDVSAVR